MEVSLLGPLSTLVRDERVTIRMHYYHYGTLSVWSDNNAATRMQIYPTIRPVYRNAPIAIACCAICKAPSNKAMGKRVAFREKIAKI